MFDALPSALAASQDTFDFDDAQTMPLTRWEWYAPALRRQLIDSGTSVLQSVLQQLGDSEFMLATEGIRN
jgi:hypothetical protein